MLRIELGSGSLDVARFDLLGTEESPITITPEQPSPQPGDWECIVFTTASRIEHAVIEHGGTAKAALTAASPDGVPMRRAAPARWRPGPERLGSCALVI